MWWTCMITSGYLKMLWVDGFSLWLFAKVQVKFQAPNALQVVIIKYNKKNFTSVKLVKNDPIYNNIKKTNCVQKDNLLSTL